MGEIISELDRVIIRELWPQQRLSTLLLGYLLPHLGSLREDDVFSNDSNVDDTDMEMETETAIQEQQNSTEMDDSEDSEDSLSDVDVDPGDQEFIPENHILPMINEDRDITFVFSPDPSASPDQVIVAGNTRLREVLNQLQANDNGIRNTAIGGAMNGFFVMGDDHAFRLTAVRSPLATTGPNRQRVVPRAAAQFHPRTRMRMQETEFERRRQYNPRARVWPVENLNKENVKTVRAPTWE
jgi:hypothetical protein